MGCVSWTFVHVEDVEPTNNLGERQVRHHGVLRRKMCFGTQSEAGSRFTVLGWTPYTLATCPELLSPVSNSIITWNLNFAEYRFAMLASSMLFMISHLPEEVNSTHYLLVQLFGQISLIGFFLRIF